MSDVTGRKRQSKGTPTGGQFAAENRSESEVDLSTASEEDVFKHVESVSIKAAGINGARVEYQGKMAEIHAQNGSTYFVPEPVDPQGSTWHVMEESWETSDTGVSWDADHREVVEMLDDVCPGCNTAQGYGGSLCPDCKSLEEDEPNDVSDEDFHAQHAEYAAGSDDSFEMQPSRKQSYSMSDVDRVRNLVERDGITGTATVLGEGENAGRTRWNVRLNGENGSVDVPWEAPSDQKPAVTEVLNTMIEDTYGYEQADDQDEWMDNLGYDRYDDDDFARATEDYDRASQYAAKTREFLGDKYDEYTYGDQS